MPPTRGARWSRLAGWLAAWLAMLAACAGPSAKTIGQAPTTTASTEPAPMPVPTASASVSSSASVAPPPPPEPPHVTALRARGFHHPPLFAGDRWYVFLGDAESLTRMYVVPAPPGKIVAVEAPLGAKVVDALFAHGRAAVLFDSLPFQGQPAGVRGVLVVHPDRPELTTDPRLFGVHDRAKTEAALARATPKIDRDLSKAALTKAAGSKEALAAALSSEGVLVHRDHQWGRFPEELGRLTASTIASSPWTKDLETAVQDAAKATCWDARCGRLFVREEGGNIKIAGLSIALAAEPRKLGKPRVVDPVPSDAIAAALTRLTLHKTVRIVASAPYDGSGGTIGVASVEGEEGGEDTFIVVVERYAARMLSFPTAYGLDKQVWTPRFVDLDGDGFTDIVAKVAGVRTDKTPPKKLEVLTTLRVPRTPVQAEAEEDGPSVLAVATAPSLDAAVKAALAIEQKPVAKADACALFTKIDSSAKFAAHSLQGGRLLQYIARFRLTSSLKPIAAATISWKDFPTLGVDCRIECDLERPYCVYPDEPNADYFWFVRAGGKLLLSGMAVYGGT